MNKRNQLVIKKFDTLDSTNRYANEELDLSTFPEYGIVWALSQTEGKGQQHAVWESEAHKNLTFSIIFHPVFLPPQNQFMLTKVLSLACVDFFKKHFPQKKIKIKWPNDIYIDENKIAGILVHNKIIGSLFSTAIAGIGLNVNQDSFSNRVPNPVSMKNINGKEYDLETILKDLIDFIIIRYEQLKDGFFEKINTEYLENLLNYQKKALYLYQEKEKEGIIEGVNEWGFLQISFSDNTKAECDMKEISLLQTK